MLLEKETVEKFGYEVSTLSKGTHKRVMVKCDYCGVVYSIVYKDRVLKMDVIDKDACVKCRYKKREDISLKLYGVKNSAQREDVREILSEKSTFRDTKKIRKAMKDKYGVEVPLQSKEIMQKHKDTIKERYGVDNVSQIDDVKEKVKQTNLDKYGSEYFLASDYARDKIDTTVKERYGVDNVFQLESTKQKIVETNLEKYGTEHRLQNEECLQQQKENVLNKYGVENVAQVEEFKEKAKQTNLERYGVEYPTQSESIKEKIIRKMIEDGRMKVFDGKSMRELSESQQKPYSTFTYHVRKYGFEEALKIEAHVNGLESFFENWLKASNITYIKHFRVENRISDFLINDNIIIELDGLFWHSDIIIKDDDYHVKKKDLYDRHGYISLFFREDEIYQKFDIVKSIVLNKMGRSTKVGARKCIIEKVNRSTANTFLDANHLMGSSRGLSYGLFYNGDLISIIQMRRTKDQQFEVARFCNKNNYSVTGGFSKLLQHFIIENKPTSVTTFIDRRYGAGKYLTELGFKYIHTYKSFVWTNVTQAFHRLIFPSNTGYEFGCAKLWDCGQAKYMMAT